MKKETMECIKIACVKFNNDQRMIYLIDIITAIEDEDKRRKEFKTVKKLATESMSSFNEDDIKIALFKINAVYAMMEVIIKESSINGTENLTKNRKQSIKNEFQDLLLQALTDSVISCPTRKHDDDKEKNETENHE